LHHSDYHSDSLLRLSSHHHAHASPPHILIATLGNHKFLNYMASVDHIFLLACLPYYTSGQTYYYPAFNTGQTEDAVKFAHEFGEVFLLNQLLTISITGFFPWQFLCSVNRPLGDARCAPGPGISLTLLKYRSRWLSPLPSSFSKPPYYILHVTVCIFSLFMKSDEDGIYV
jgi:hypothetical protein